MTRVAWLVSFVVPLILAALLLTLEPAHAAPPAGGAVAGTHVGAALGETVEGEPEAEGDEEALEECVSGEAEDEEASEEEVELGEEDEEDEEELEAEEEAEGCEPPARCLLRSADARLVVVARRHEAKLSIDYTAFKRTGATVAYRIAGGSPLGRAERQLSTKGELRLTTRLTRAQMSRARAAKGFVVTIDPAAAPKSCDRYDTRHLTIRKAAGRKVEWLQSDSIFGAAA